jgi:hypothetical protein
MNIDNQLVNTYGGYASWLLYLWFIHTALGGFRVSQRFQGAPKKGAGPLLSNLAMGSMKGFLESAAYWTSRDFLGSIGSCSRKDAGFLRR